MRNINQIVSTIIAIIIFSTSGYGQNSAHVEKYNKAIELLNLNMYKSAQTEFLNSLEIAEKLGIPNTQEHSSIISQTYGYLAIIAIELHQDDASYLYNKVENFKLLPANIDLVRFKYASSLFDSEQYSKAVNVFSKIDHSNLSKNEINDYYFRFGYSYMTLGQFKHSLALFENLIELPNNKFTNPSIYYTGYIHYLNKEFDSAISFFSKLINDPRFSLSSKYYILESNFMLQNYSYVTQNGEALYDILTNELKTRTARVLSEAFFAQNNTQKARLYFEKYSMVSGQLNRNDIYFAGILSYTQRDYFRSIDLLKQVIDREDSISQNAAYHLAKSYIEIKNKIEALNYFKIASQYSFDSSIQEDALFNYAKLSFDLNSNIEPFKEYMSKYTPSQEKFNEIQNYIATAYLLDKDYTRALQALSNIINPSDNEIINLKKAAFLRGMELMELNSYREAIPIFNTALQRNSSNISLSNIIQFWLAEAYYRDNQFQRSIEINLSLATRNNSFKNHREYPLTMFNLAYGYFRISNYDLAEQWFSRFLSNNLNTFPVQANEARVRRGDCLFMLRKYQEAIDSYNKVNSSDINLQNHSNFQIAIALGLIGNDRAKIETLRAMLPKSLDKSIRPQVLYELARTLVQIGDYTGAIFYLNEINNNFSNTHFYPKSLLELGLISLNRGENFNAINFYKRIIEQTPNSPETQSALIGLENIYQDMGRAGEYLKYLDELGLSATKSTEERENILFNSAEKLFLAGNFSSAITSLNSFIDAHPNSSKLSQSYFYLGESYLKIDKPELALDAFYKVMELGQGAFNELATLNYARISFNIQKYAQAAKAYSTLLHIAKLENNQLEAHLGLVNSLFMDKQYQNAIAEAKRTERLNLNHDQRRGINYILAKSLYNIGKRDEAMTYLNELSKDKRTVEGAESAFMIISHLYDKGDFEQVESKVFEFSDSRTPHNYWLARSFILLGDTYAERENWAQAKATYNSILESYKGANRKDIVEQINIRLQKIAEIE